MIITRAFPEGRSRGGQGKTTLLLPKNNERGQCNISYRDSQPIRTISYKTPSQCRLCKSAQVDARKQLQIFQLYQRVYRHMNIDTTPYLKRSSPKHLLTPAIATLKPTPLHIYITLLHPPPHPRSQPKPPSLPPSSTTSKQPIHSLMRQLDPQKSRRIRRHRPRHRRPHPREKRPQPPTPIQPPHRPPNRRPPLRTLQPALNRIDRKHRDPHGHAGGPPGRHHRRQTQRARRLPVGILGRHHALDILVGGEVRGAARPVAGERHQRAAEDGADAAFGVELADDVEAAGVAGLFAGAEGFLALDLEEHFDALEGGGDEGHGDGGEEASEGELGDRVGGGRGGGEGVDEAFAHVVALGVGGLVCDEGGGRGIGRGREVTQKLTATVEGRRWLVDVRWRD